jgi:magnesium chelatase subunit I
VTIPDQVLNKGLELVHELRIDSLRAEITLFEAARAYAVLDGRYEVSVDDLCEVAPMALRIRRSTFMEKYLVEQLNEENEMKSVINHNMMNTRPQEI